MPSPSTTSIAGPIGSGVAVLVLWGACAAAEVTGSRGITDLRQGLVCPVGDVLVTTEGAEDTVTGEINLLSDVPQIVAEGPVIPAVLGYSMSVQGEIAADAPMGPIRVVTEHPPMGPEGITRQTTLSLLGGPGRFHRGYGFDLSLELVPGPWTITVFDGDMPIVRASFVVVPPETRPDLVGLCAGPMLS